MVWWISKLMYVSLYKFSSVDTAGGCTNFSRKERKGSGDSYEASIRFTRLGGLKRIRLQIAYRSVDRCQDRMLGWVSIFASWNTCSSCPLPNTASRKACQHCWKQSLIITPGITHCITHHVLRFPLRKPKLKKHFWQD